MSVTHSENLDQLAAALVKAQGAVKSAIRDSQNAFLKNRYADLASVWEACRDVLTSNGLSVVQLPGYDQGMTTLTTMLLHVSGQWIRGTAGAPMAKQDAQSAGSVITYLRRYALAAAVGVVQEDDDGEGARKNAGGRGKVASGSAKDASPVPPSAPPDFTKPPAALAGEPDEDFGELVDPNELQRILQKAANAGLTAATWPAFHQEVTGRAYDSILVAHVKQLEAAIAKRRAARDKATA